MWIAQYTERRRALQRNAVFRRDEMELIPVGVAFYLYNGQRAKKRELRIPLDKNNGKTDENIHIFSLSLSLSLSLSPPV